MNEATPAPIDRSAYAASDALSHRQTASTLRLLGDAAGGPRDWATKLGRLARTFATLLNRRELRRRVDRLKQERAFEAEPTPVQLVVLGIDMLRYFIEPGARDYYASRGIGFGLHQVLRVLDDPSSMIDPVGLLSTRDTIIGHVLQVVHANPIYDLQLLEMFEDGLDAIESQTAEMIAGTHPRTKSIGAIVEDPEYHARLLDYIRAYRRDPMSEQLRRRDGAARNDASFVLAEETFGAMPSAFRYATHLPTRILPAITHVRTRRVIDPAFCEPRALAVVARLFGSDQRVT